MIWFWFSKFVFLSFITPQNVYLHRQDFNFFIRNTVYWNMVLVWLVEGDYRDQWYSGYECEWFWENELFSLEDYRRFFRGRALGMEFISELKRWLWGVEMQFGDGIHFGIEKGLWGVEMQLFYGDLVWNLTISDGIRNLGIEM